MRSTLFGLWVVLASASASASVAHAQPGDTTEATAPAVEAPAAPVPAVVAPAPAKAEEKTEPEDDGMETLVGSGDVDHGGFGGPLVRFSRFRGNDAVLVGALGGWLVNHSFILGGGGFGMANRIKVPAKLQTTVESQEFMMGYGGVYVGYVILPKKLVHATVGLLVGGGSVGFGRRMDCDRGDCNMNRYDGYGRETQPMDEFFVAEPEINVEVNVLSFMRVGAGGTYRLVTQVNGLGLENDDVRGPSGSVFVKFGKF